MGPATRRQTSRTAQATLRYFRMLYAPRRVPHCLRKHPHQNRFREHNHDHRRLDTASLLLAKAVDLDRPRTSIKWELAYQGGIAVNTVAKDSSSSSARP